MNEGIGLLQAMYTQRAIRQFKPDPVPEELLLKLIEAATKAPSGANAQPWRFIVVRDVELKRQIGEYYKKSWYANYGDRKTSPSLGTKVRTSAANLAEHMHEVPALILVCIEHKGTPSTISRGSSIYPAVQNLLLAARAYGLGSVLTTLHKRYEDEIKHLLGIPANVETAALLPIGYPVEGVRYGPTTRWPPDEFTHWDRWNSLP